MGNPIGLNPTRENSQQTRIKKAQKDHKKVKNQIKTLRVKPRQM